MPNHRVTNSVKTLFDDLAAYVLITFVIAVWIVLNLQAWFNWSAWKVWLLFGTEAFLFLWWLWWSTGPSAIRDRTDELEQLYGPQPHDAEWKNFDATMKRWEDNERARKSLPDYDDYE